MDPSALQTIWFMLFGVLVIGYAILDGFDLGVGVLSLFRKDGHERRLMINAIGPVWDGNEVWLLTAGGALFAAFPPVYATAFSALYLALMLLLVALIARAVSMEFRHQVDSERWRVFWDRAFGIGSLLAAVLFGVAVGNIMRGLPLDETFTFTGSFFGLLNPYSILMGLLSLAMFMCQGAIYMGMKAEGELETAMQGWATRTYMGWVSLYVIATIATVFVSPFLLEGVFGNPIAWVLMILVLGGFALVPLSIGVGRMGRAFLASSAAIAGMVGLVGLGLYPRILPSLTNLDYSLTVGAHSSSDRALTAMLIIALIGLPIVLAYTIFIYRVFKGKVKLGENSY